MDNRERNTFTIRFPTKMRIVLLTILCLTEIGLVYLTTLPKYRVAGIVFGILNAFLCVFAAMASFLFRIQVNNTRFSVTTRMGKKFTFTCNDIHKITCEKRDSVKYGPSFFIHILAQENEVIAEGTMDGFSQLAGYLLTKLSTGEIPDSAASGSSRNELRRYANGEIFPKKTKNLI